MGPVQPEMEPLATSEQIFEAVDVSDKSVVVEGGEIDALELAYLVDEGGTPLELPAVEHPLGQAGVDRRSSDPGLVPQRRSKSSSQPHDPRGRDRTILATERNHAGVHLASEGTLLDALEQESELFGERGEGLRQRGQVHRRSERVSGVG